MVSGWILDARADFDRDALEVWLWTPRGTRRVVDGGYRVPFYAAGSEDRLRGLGHVLDGLPEVRQWDFAEARTDLRSTETQEVLRIYPRHYGETKPLAEMIDDAGGHYDFRLYNVDLRLNQRYLHDVKVVPSAWASYNGQWRALEDRFALDYEVPGLTMATLDLSVANPLGIPRLQDKFLGFRLGEVEVEGRDEVELLHALMNAMGDVDPDVILTDGGDSFLFPFLVNKAAALGVDLQLGRDVQRMSVKKGKSYFTYGRIVHKPGQYMLRGRVHLDRGHFAYREAALYGPVELSRLAGIPLQEMSRLTPGTAFSTMQMNEALRQGALVLYKKNLPEDFKTADELVQGDRGGFYFEPEVGIHEGIVEVDFSSLYPSIMVTRNLSYETMRCSCCIGDGRPVPGLEKYYSCIRRKGIVPIALEPLITRRRYYKKRRNEDDSYTQRDSILKWTLVTCLDGSTVVPYKLNGTYRIGKIGGVIDQYLDERGGVTKPTDGLIVFGPDKDFHLEEKRVAKVIKALAPERLLSIRTGGGREILATPNHQFFALSDDGSLAQKRADELQIGDYLPEYTSLPLRTRGEESINVLEPLYETLSDQERSDWHIKGEGLKEAICKNYSPIMHQALDQGYTYQSAWHWKQGNPLPLQFLPELHLSYAQMKPLYICRGMKYGMYIPADIKLDEELAFFFGFYTGDGSTTQSQVRFSVGLDEPEIIGKLMNCAYEKFGLVGQFRKESHANAYALWLNSLALAQIMQVAFGIGPSSEKGKLVIPLHVLNGGEAIKWAYLSGLLASDGCVSSGYDWAFFASYKREFVEAISLLLLSLGIRSTFRSMRIHDHPLYTVDVYCSDIKSRLWLKATHRQRPGASKESHSKHRRDFPVVQSGLLDLCRKLHAGRHIAHRQFISTEELKRTLIEIRERCGGHLPTSARNLMRYLAAGIVFRRVEQIAAVPQRTKYVYCFETKEAPHGFVLAGGVLCLNSFGYQGFKNHRFGRIECHEAINAYAREILLRSMEIAEGHGYEVVHGIVDSLWLRPTDHSDLIEATMAHISDAAGVPLDLEGTYKWTVFLPCKTTGVGALNRYYGLFQDGKLKLRGIELRKHDTPPFVNRLQEATLGILAEAPDAAGFMDRIPRVLDLVKGTLWKLQKGEIPLEEAVITKVITKPLGEYVVMTNSVAALRQMRDRGFNVEPGEYIRYIITREASRDHRLKVRVAEFVDGSEALDAEAYTKLVCRATETLLAPFGYTEEVVRRRCSPLP